MSIIIFTFPLNHYWLVDINKSINFHELDEIVWKCTRMRWHGWLTTPVPGAGMMQQVACSISCSCVLKEWLTCVISRHVCFPTRRTTVLSHCLSMPLLTNVESSYLNVVWSILFTKILHNVLIQYEGLNTSFLYYLF